MPRLILTVLLGIVLLIALALTGNGDAIDVLNIQDDTAIPAGELSGTHTLGQTFVAHQPNLHSIELRWFVSNDVQFAGASQIILHLRRANESTDVATATLPASSLQHNQFARFDFSPIADSQNQAFYFFLDASRANLMRGFVSVWASGEDIYPDGALIIDGLPTNRDLAFRTYSQPDALTLIATALQSLIANIEPLTIIIFAPFVLGWALLFIANQTGASLIDFFAKANALGLALLSASVLLVYKFGTIAQWLIIATIFLLAAIVWRKRRPTLGQFAPLTGTQSILLLLALGALGVNMLQVHNVPVPLWVDSPSHAATIDALLNRNLQLDVFYHLGFHSVAAWFTQLAGVSIPAAMLILGQWTLTLGGLAMFALSKKLTGSEIAGIASAICVWFLAPTPAYFVTWGRYPLLLGVALLPIALLITIEFLERPKFEWGAFALAALTCAGMILAHLRLAVPFAAFIGFYILLRVEDARVLRRTLLLAAIGVSGAIAWFAAFMLSGTTWQEILMRNANGIDLIDAPTAIAVLQTQHGTLVWVLSIIGLLVLLMKRNPNAFLIGAWSLATFLIAFVPLGSLLVAPSFVLLLAFIPASLVLGEMIAVLTLPGKIEKVVLATLVGVAFIGAYSMQAIVNPATVLFTSADQAAMEWLPQHTVGEIYIPSDGGIWLAQQTGRRAIALDANSAAVRDTPAGLARWLDENQIAYIYLGRRAGILNKTQFACQPERYTPVYYRDGIAIFSVGKSDARVRLPVACDR
jgi:hypothetical protein